MDQLKEILKSFVSDEPEVEVTVTSSSSEFKQGDEMTLICNVTRSNPQPHSYVWLKNGSPVIGWRTFQYDKIIEPEDSGSYACTAKNTVGTRTSNPRHISVLCKFPSFLYCMHVRELMHHGLYHHRRHAKTISFLPDRPRKTSISISEKNNEVKVGNPLTFSCDTDASPAPMTYSWYRYSNNKQIDSSQWKSKTTDNNILYLKRVQRTDEACYMCNATNIINTGENSGQVCIRVLCKYFGYAGNVLRYLSLSKLLHQVEH